LNPPELKFACESQFEQDFLKVLANDHNKLREFTAHWEFAWGDDWTEPKEFNKGGTYELNFSPRETCIVNGCQGDNHVKKEYRTEKTKLTK
jgi:hypothetical protein